MDLTDFCEGATWAIEESAMAHMMASIPRLMRMENFDQAAVKIREQAAYEPELTVRDGVAVVPVAGTISKRAGFLSFLFGGAAIGRIRADIDAAMADRRVRALVLAVDSPGGRVNGVAELGDYIFAAREQKPIVTFSDGNITSAATWIGSAGNQKIISPTAQDGSIGVITMHADFSKMDEKMGVKFTYLTAGKYKAIGNDAEPLSDEARGMIESRLAATYDVFVSAMARYRDADEDTVRSDMADGRIFVGQQAVDVGLADRLGSLEDAMAAAADLADGRDKNFYNKGVNTMKLADITTVAQLQEAFPQLAKDLADQAATEARAGVDTEAARTEGRTEGDKNATERIMGLAKIHFGEQPAKKFEGIVTSGVSIEQYQAMAEALGGGQQADGGGNSHEADQDAQFRQQMAAGIAGASAPDPGAGGGGSDGGNSGPQSWEDAVKIVQAEQQCSHAQAVKQAARQYPELHQAKYAPAH